ncbi:hypothetical protein PV325_009277 [Microctonus aethiopoides]|uniref:D-aminoacyl-tRNA deacylase n=1 Tax=Microctonus aethiopoides TaxID=144406 RepID=A0AA39FHP3_9HYME|nr:hypothetical protein PV326_001388 [Microctonus aethiopoides]KAK0089070.1 hypothetical protein PV325_009277 [Microctonus aethiopoides]KAK0169785.1 hypothetical protein PV328_010426 [Microctonus aethiopoides]
MKTDDTLEDVQYIVKKILNLKIFDGENGKRWAASVIDKQYEILCISQFTLYHVIKGNKLDFHKAMPSGAAESLYIKFLTELRTKYRPEQIKDGKFGEMMEVHIENSGPVTLEIESPSKENFAVVPTKK